MKRYKCWSETCNHTARRNKDNLPAPMCVCGAGAMIDALDSYKSTRIKQTKRPRPKADPPKHTSGVKGAALRAVEFWMDQGAGVVGSWHPDEMYSGGHDARLVKSMVLEVLRKVPAEELQRYADRLKIEY